MNSLLPIAKTSVNVVLALALALLVAAWLWRIAGPREAARATAGAASTAAPDLVAAGKLFGAPVAPVAAAPVNPLADVLLKGVYRSRDGAGGFAVVQIGNQPPRAVMAGGEIRTGLRLSSLGADHAIFSGERGETRLDLPPRPALIRAAPK